MPAQLRFGLPEWRCDSAASTQWESSLETLGQERFSKTKFSKTNGLTEEFSVWSLTSVGPSPVYLRRQFFLHSPLWRSPRMETQTNQATQVRISPISTNPNWARQTRRKLGWKP